MTENNLSIAAIKPTFSQSDQCLCCKLLSIASFVSTVKFLNFRTPKNFAVSESESEKFTGETPN